METTTVKPRPLTPATATANKDRRRATRTKVRGLLCDRGEIIDLSTKGMRLRVRWRWQESQIRAITIVDGDISVPVHARCVWCRQEGMFTHIVGLAFQRAQPRDLDRLQLIVERRGQGEAD